MTLASKGGGRFLKNRSISVKKVRVSHFLYHIFGLMCRTIMNQSALCSPDPKLCLKYLQHV